MRKILTALVLLFCAFSLRAADSDSIACSHVAYLVYADLKPFKTNILGNNENVNVRIDLGQFQSSSKNYVLLDENGKNLKLNSEVAMLNYMARRGWRFEQTYVDDELSRHWLMSKSVSDPAQITDGLSIKNYEE